MISVGSEVQVFPGPPFAPADEVCWCELWFVWVYLILAVCCQVFAMVGAVAQLGEHLLCKQGVSGSIPLSSTNSLGVETERYPLKK